MSSHGLTKENFMRTIPSALREDASVVALAETASEVLARRLDEVDRARIFANIDRLDEPLLDILAHDLKVDWYDYNYPVKAKRAVIKSSILVHKRLGTVYAVKSALGSVYPDSEVEEWFNYGGEPFRFQIVLNTAQSRAPAEFFSIKRTVDYYKRFSAHMDGVIFQCGIGIVIGTQGRGYLHRSIWTGRKRSGTVPWRDMKGGLGDTHLEVGAQAAGKVYEAAAAGTRPWRNTPGGVAHGDLELASRAHGWPYTSEAAGKTEAGTTPKRQTGGGAAEGGLGIDVVADGFPYATPQAGTQPYRSSLPGLNDEGLEIEARSRGFPYTASAASQVETGVAPQRSTRARLDGRAVWLETAAEGHPYTVPSSGRQRTGTFPDREAGGAVQAGALLTEAEAEGFHYRVPVCGTSYCRS